MACVANCMVFASLMPTNVCPDPVWKPVREVDAAGGRATVSSHEVKLHSFKGRGPSPRAALLLLLLLIIIIIIIMVNCLSQSFTASRLGQDKRGRHRSAAIPPNRLSRETAGNKLQNMTTCCKLLQTITTRAHFNQSMAACKEFVTLL